MIVRPVLQGAAVRVLLAVLAGHRTHGAIARVCGFSARSTVSWHLKVLRDHGFVDWQLGSNGTLHPLVEAIPVAGQQS